MKDLFRIQRNCLRLMGHRCDDEKLARLPRWRRVVYTASLLLVLSAQWPLINYVAYNIDDITLATAGLSICFTNILTAIKIATFFVYKRQFVQLMERLSSMSERMTEPVAKTCLVASNRIANNLVKVYYYSVSLTGLYFMIGPLFKIVWSKVTMRDIVRDLPMPMRFSFDFVSSPGYEITYIYTGFVTLTVVMYASAIDGIFLSSTLNLSAHFRALQQFIEHSACLAAEELLVDDLSCYIQYHNLLLELSANVRSIYTPIIFGQFLITSLQLCVILYQLVTNMGAILVLVIYCTFLSSIMLQLLIYCYGGEILRNESLMVANAVQLSDWYNCTPRNRRMLAMVLQRAQREVVIKAGFYEASLANFLSIFRAALSYITLIQSIE